MEAATPSILSRSFYERAAPDVALALLGTSLFVNGVGGVIVETEAYDRQDPASHSFTGPTRRNGSMFGPVAHVYIYRSYGIHWCLNVVCARDGESGSAVLIRAIQPTAGLAEMRQRRGTDRIVDLCRGPGRLCKALGIDGPCDGRSLAQPPFRLIDRTAAIDPVTGARIGITRGQSIPWRFGLRGSPYLSRSFRL